MKKLLCLLLLLVPQYSFGNDNTVLEIIPRSQWGADEQFTYRESTYWTDIIQKRLNTPVVSISETEKKRRNDIYQQKIDYINKNFAAQNTVTEKVTHDGTEKLAWQIQKSDYVNAIVIHHTATEYASSEEGIKNIYKFHSLNRQWGDIGYNYLIGYNGEVYEGRKGGDYTVAAHSKWNNISTVGIAVIGDYSQKEISTSQYKALEKLVQYLSKRYGIDLSKDYYYNSECAGAACNIFPLETYLNKTLTGHRDTAHTSCPGDKLYAQIEKIRLSNLELTAGFEPVERGDSTQYTEDKKSISNQRIVEILQEVSPRTLEKLVLLLDKRLEIEKNQEKRQKLQIIRIIAKQILEG